MRERVRDRAVFEKEMQVAGVNRRNALSKDILDAHLPQIRLLRV